MKEAYRLAYGAVRYVQTIECSWGDDDSCVHELKFAARSNVYDEIVSLPPAAVGAAYQSLTWEDNGDPLDNAGRYAKKYSWKQREKRNTWVNVSRAQLESAGLTSPDDKFPVRLDVAEKYEFEYDA